MAMNFLFRAGLYLVHVSIDSLWTMWSVTLIYALPRLSAKASTMQ